LHQLNAIDRGHHRVEMGMSLSAFQQEKSGDFIGLHRLRNSWELGEKSPLRDNLCQ
jgi:hypothetical protein